MIRGLLSGVGAGALVCTGVLSVVSLIAPQPAGNAPPLPPRVEAPAPADPSPMGASSPLPEGGVMTESPVLGAAQSGEQADLELGPELGAELGPEPTPEAAPLVVDSEAAPAPQTGGDEVALTAPQLAQAPDLAGNSPETPVLPSPQTPAPTVPVTEPDITIQAAPNDQVVVLDPEPIQTADSPAALDQSPDLVAPDAQTQAPAIEKADTAAPDISVAPPVVAPDGAEQAPLADTQTQTPEAPENIVAGLAAPAVPQAPQPDAPAQDAAPPQSNATESEEAPALDAAPIADAPALPPAGPAPQVGLSGTAATTLPTGNSGVRVIRPGGEPTADTAAAAPAPGDLPLIDDSAKGALERFATPVELPADTPRMALVLIDDGSLKDGAEALAASGVALTIAIPAGAPDAAALMAQYRAKGIEVVALIDLPDGAVPSDAAVAAEAARSAVPEAVALLTLEPTDRGSLAELLAAALANGQGVVALSSGLGGLERAAQGAGVPAAEIFRDLDSDGQSAAVIRRFMDQAAFRARQDGSVVLIGRVRPDTISALTLWATANRAGQVAQVPVSAVLLAQ